VNFNDHFSITVFLQAIENTLNISLKNLHGSFMSDTIIFPLAKNLTQLKIKEYMCLMSSKSLENCGL